MLQSASVFGSMERELTFWISQTRPQTRHPRSCRFRLFSAWSNAQTTAVNPCTTMDAASLLTLWPALFKFFLKPDLTWSGKQTVQYCCSYPKRRYRLTRNSSFENAYTSKQEKKEKKEKICCYKSLECHNPMRLKRRWTIELPANQCVRWGSKECSICKPHSFRKCAGSFFFSAHNADGCKLD